MAASYPERPTQAQQADVSSFISLLARLYPCWVCAKDFEAHVKRDAPRVGSRGDLSRWLCQAHNHVNRKLGKPQFDCQQWDERWRTGWRDGRCD
ncbi:hypothetical protein CDD81_5486 [Ophiocordyceps australis]|uniref:Sulfhydryl oxidase n=1 Tax=Ophiocordyceps australis TaxID=1399860 RepID=A0A2C5XMV8_9HYPO|nr:hypothetical protein CDD81_5486 [Ophiocordyceps australis]